jgi:hypothetical protein
MELFLLCGALIALIAGIIRLFKKQWAKGAIALLIASNCLTLFGLALSEHTRAHIHVHRNALNRQVEELKEELSRLKPPPEAEAP